MSIFSIKVIRYFWIYLLLFSLEIETVNANSIAFENANKLFENGKYSEAILKYKNLSANGVSANLLFNLGNAHFKSGSIGQAMVNYQRALKLNPRHPDLIANLNFAYKHTQTEPIPITFQQKWIRKLSIEEWTLITSLSVSLFLITLGIRQLNSSLVKNKLWIKIFASISSLLVLLTAISTTDYFGNKQAFVIQKEATVHSNPVEQSPELFKVTDGMELIVLGRTREFINIQSSIGSTGWIHQNSIELTLP